VHTAFFTNSYQPVMSGVVRSISTFRSALTQMGHNVFIFAQHADDHEDTEPFIFRYPSIEVPPYQDYPLSIPLSPFVDRLLPSLKLDVIHSHHPFLIGGVAADKARRLQVPLVFTFHTRYRDYSHYIALNQPFVKDQIDRWVKDYLRRCHHIIAPSESMRSLLAEEYGVLDQVSVVPTGIDLALYEQASGEAVRQRLGWQDKIVLISIGRLAKEKNWALLLDAAAPILQNHENTLLAVLGDGAERSELEKRAAALHIAESVAFLGSIPMTDIPAYLKAADLFCFASTTETQGLVTMEAMAAGLPVVAVDATGTRDAVEHDREGLLTPNDSKALSRALEEMLADETVRAKFSRQALIKAQSFEIRKQGEKLIAAYKQAQEAARAGHFVTVE